MKKSELKDALKVGLVFASLIIIIIFVLCLGHLEINKKINQTEVAYGNLASIGSGASNNYITCEFDSECDQSNSCQPEHCTGTEGNPGICIKNDPKPRGSYCNIITTSPSGSGRCLGTETTTTSGTCSLITNTCKPNSDSVTRTAWTCNYGNTEEYTCDVQCFEGPPFVPHPSDDQMIPYLEETYPESFENEEEAVSEVESMSESVVKEIPLKYDSSEIKRESSVENTESTKVENDPGNFVWWNPFTWFFRF